MNNHDENKPGHEVIVTALERMVEVASLINELKRQHERHVRKDELRTSLTSGGGINTETDIVGFGELILEVSVLCVTILCMFCFWFIDF